MLKLEVLLMCTKSYCGEVALSVSSENCKATTVRAIPMAGSTMKKQTFINCRLHIGHHSRHLRFQQPSSLDDFAGQNILCDLLFSSSPKKSSLLTFA
ncbi:hypothetical protein U0070_013785 [Myodes glareolus]|uniref:Uncharacterized protein n=1 Tax=Myodes glareolus TaxID=447135 RepID=A0AAW0JB04_MYOGA